MRTSHLGKKLPESQKEKIGQKSRGRKMSKSARSKISQSARRRVGSLNNRWKGGKFVNSKGHIIIPWQRKRRALHRVIWEIIHGYALRDDDIIHHKNGSPADNRIETLQLMTSSEHTSLHKRKIHE